MEGGSRFHRERGGGLEKAPPAPHDLRPHEHWLDSSDTSRPPGGTPRTHLPNLVCVSGGKGSGVG